MQVQARAEMVARRQELSGFRPAGNILPFLRRDGSSGRPAPDINVSGEARPAPVRDDRFSRIKAALFLGVSLVIHTGVYAAFQREAPPLASVGVQAISVEIVLGGERVAGVAEKPTEAQATVNAVAARGEASELVKPETARARVKVAEVVTPVEPLRTAPLMKPETFAAAPRPEPPAETQRAVTEPEPRPVEARQAERAPVREDRPVQQAARALTVLATPSPSPEQTVAAEPEVLAALPDAAAELPRPRPEPPKTAGPPPPEVKPATPPKRKRAAATRQKKDASEDVRTRESTNSTASQASSGIGRGRSDADSNYRGLVRARLARNQHFPADAKRSGQEGRAVVRFFIEASGSVSTVILLQGTGVASLDSEAQAVVRRSAPFPPPPSGQRELFRVPITFDITTQRL